jgi:archaellum component FlaF (FlaF/FlaG flagellin family)
MFSLLFSSVGGYLIGGVIIVGLIGGAVLYVRHNESTIANLQQKMLTLKEQSSELQTVYKALQTDMLNVQHAEDAANQQILDIRNKALVASQTVRKQNYANSPVTQSRVNKDTSDLFRQLEDISRAK